MLGKEKVLYNNNNDRNYTVQQKALFSPLKSYLEFFRASFTYLSLAMDLATRPPLFAHRGTERVSEKEHEKMQKQHACQSVSVSRVRVKTVFIATPLTTQHIRYHRTSPRPPSNHGPYQADRPQVHRRQGPPQAGKYQGIRSDGRKEGRPGRYRGIARGRGSVVQP